jgi:hypothetical protein
LFVQNVFDGKGDDALAGLLEERRQVPDTSNGCMLFELTRMR